MFAIDFEAKDFFLDRSKIQNRIGKDNAKRLSRIGAFVRKRVRTQTLRRRKTPSKPGSPPSIHSKDSVATLKNVQFAVDRTWERMIVGPVLLNQVEHGDKGTTTVPERLEKGGIGIIHEERWSDRSPWMRRDFRRTVKPEKQYRKRQANYAARPFMGPTLEKEAAAGNIIGVFAG